MTKNNAKRKMSAQSIAIIVLSVLLVAAIAFGGTMAWFTAKDTSNTANGTFGEVKVSLSNKDIKFGGTDNTKDTSTHLLVPGSTVTLPTVSYTGDIAAWVRFTVTVTDADQTKPITFALGDESAWTQGSDGNFYLTGGVDGKGKAEISLGKILIGTDLSDEHMGKTLSISIVVEATQKANNNVEAANADHGESATWTNVA